MAIRLDAHRDEFHRDQQWHKPVRVATTANITIATALNAGDTLDGITLAAGDRVLVKDQSTGSQNGIYIAGASPARAYDMLTGIQALGAVVRVLAGTANGGTWWECTNTTLPTIGTDALTWQEVALGGSSLEITDGVTTVDPTDDITFAGSGMASVDVTDDGGGAATVTISVPGEVPVGGLHKILVKRTSNFTTAASNDSVPDYDTVIEDTMSDSWWDAGDPDGFLVTADYDGLDAIFVAKAAWADPGSSAYVEMKMYYFPAASGRNRPIDASADEDYLIGVEQHPATDNVNHFIELVSDPITVGTGDRIFCALRTSNSQTAITYNGRVSITLGAHIVGTGGGTNVTPSDDNPLIESGSGDPGVSDEYSRADHVHPEFGGTGIGPILISDTPSTPLVFADLIQNEAQDDLVYADP